jgi:mannose-6-phosphate isomerase-like protein (cupin superfamily)
MADAVISADEELEKHHLAAEATVTPYSYTKPSAVTAAKGRVNLGRSELIRSVVQIVQKHGGENNLHYHTSVDTFWMVLRGRARFYGPGDRLIGEFGPHEGTITPRYSRYWFENIGDEDLELLQVAASVRAGQGGSGRTDVEAQRYKLGTANHFDATKP